MPQNQSQSIYLPCPQSPKAIPYRIPVPPPPPPTPNSVRTPEDEQCQNNYRQREGISTEVL